MYWEAQYKRVNALMQNIIRKKELKKKIGTIFLIPEIVSR